MAEDLLGATLGDEDEKPEGMDLHAGGSARALAASLAVVASHGNPQVASATANFLNDQSALLRVQKRHLEEEHAARLHQLRGQAREGDVRRVGLRLRVALQIFYAVVATLLGIGVIVMLRDAFASRSVVVEPFDAPAALAERGLSGKVVAAGVLDELVLLQNATRLSARKRNLSNAWTGDIKLAVPETGISVSEIPRVLNARFGHDLHIYGDLIEGKSGDLRLRVRGDGVPPKSFTGRADELSALSTAAAEYIYSQSEPALWASYLANTGRFAEAIEFGRTAYPSVDERDKPYLLNYWANSLADSGGSIEEAMALYRAALQLKPDFWIAYSNLVNALWAMGEEERAWQVGLKEARLAGGRPGRASEEFYQNWDTLTWNLPAWRASLVADANAHAGIGSANSAAGPAIADAAARMHDAAAARLALDTTSADERDPAGAAISHFVRGWLAFESGDAQRAVAEMTSFAASYANNEVRYNYPGYNCWIAPAEEAVGHRDKADAVLAAAGKFVDCYRFRGDILDGRGDWPAAQQAYARAVALAPDLPGAYFSWGVALARHGDLAGAEAKLNAAITRGPHWSDPHKALGDVLFRRGKKKEAVAKYDEALQYAPHWAALQEARKAAANGKD